MFNRSNFSYTPPVQNNFSVPGSSGYQYQFPNNGPQLMANVSHTPGTSFYTASVGQPISKNASVVAVATNIPPQGSDHQTEFQAGVGVQFKLGK